MVASARGIDHHQRVVGDDEISLRAVATGALDEAFPVMRAASIDALAALVGERGDPAFAKQGAEPAGQVAADHVAIAGEGGPARDQLREDRWTSREAALQRVFEIEQAEVVFASLAHDNRGRAVGALDWPGAAAFGAQLSLEVLGEGRNPDGASARIGPER